MLFSEPKIPQLSFVLRVLEAQPGFSALQRAENSSMRADRADALFKLGVSVLFSEPKIPQSLVCRSSRCHNAVSVLFSEPKIPQFNIQKPLVDAHRVVSVLFSEPKIPQFGVPSRQRQHLAEFQCSSASRKFLNLALSSEIKTVTLGFSALQRAENSSISRCAGLG